MTKIETNELKNSGTKIKYIYHLADIHIRRYERHKEYRKVFKKLMRYLKSEQKNSKKEDKIAVICGDILHSKTELSPNCVDLVSNFLKDIAEIMPVIIIMGNHDLNIGNKSHLDALYPIINNINHKNIYYLRETGVYNFENITFGVTSVYNDNKILKAKKIIDTKKHKICLYHGIVNGSQNDVGTKLHGEACLEDFKGYDLVLLGDIHKFQYLNDNKTIAYPGSLICQNYSESSKHHGLIKWNLNDYTSEHVEIYNPYGYSTITIVQGKLEKKLKKLNLPKKPRIRLKVINTDENKLNKIIKKLKKKFDVQEIVKNVITESIEEREQVEEENNSSFNIEKLLKKNLKKNLSVTKEDQVEIIKIHNETIESLPEENVSDAKNIKWEIRKLAFSNMFSYGENNAINFMDKETVIGIVASNGYGKSSVIDSILYCLFEKCSRGEKKTDMMNYSKDNFYVYLELSIEKEVFYILRFGQTNPRGFTTKVMFWKKSKDSDDIEDLTGVDKNKTNKLIKSYVGDYEDFVGTCVSVQNNHNSFTDLTQAKRKDFLQQLLRLSLYENLYTKANEKRKELFSTEKVMKTQIEDLEIETLKSDIKLSKKNIKKNKKEIKHLNKKLKKVQNELLSNEKELSFLTKNSNFNSNNINEDLDQLNKCRKEKKKEKGELSDEKRNLKKKLEKINQKIQDEDNNLEIIKKRETELQEKIEKIKEILNNSDKNKHTKLNERFESLNKEYSSLENSYQDSHKKYFSEKELFLKELNKLESLKDFENRAEEKKKLEEELKTKTKKQTQIKEKINHFQELADKLKTHKYNKDCKYCIQNKFVIDATEAKNKLPDLLNKKEKTKNKIIELEKNLKKYETTDDQYKRYLESKENVNQSKKKLEELRKKQNDYLEKICLISLKSSDAFKDIIQQNTAFFSEQKTQKELSEKIKKYTNELNLLIVNKKLFEEKDLIENSLLIKNKNKKLKNKTQLKELSEKIKVVDLLQNNKILLKTIKQNKEKSDELDNKLKKLEEIINNEKINKKVKKTQYKQAKKSLNKYETIKTELRYYKIYTDLMGKNGIPNNLLKKFIPIVEAGVNNILTMLYDFTISLKNVDGDIEFKIIRNKQKKESDDSKEKSYNALSASGFEKFIINICIRVVFCKFSTLSKPNILFIDEMLANMDNKNKNNINILFDYLKTQFDSVIIISHLEELKGSVDKIINIKKKHNFSHVNNMKESSEEMFETINEKINKPKKIIKKKKSQKIFDAEKNSKKNLIEELNDD